MSPKPTCTLASSTAAAAFVGPPTITNSSPAPVIIADTGSTAHFCTTDLPVTNKKLADCPIMIRNPNGSVMYSTHTAELDLPSLPQAARLVHIVPDLEEHSLIAIGQLCDAGCHVTFSATEVTVSVNDNIVLTGHRTLTTRLWHLDLPVHSPRDSDQTNATIGSATPAELVAFAHASLFSPALSTLSAALTKGFLPNFPGLTTDTLRKYPPQSAPMIKGHLDQTRKNQRSTKASSTTPLSSDSNPADDDFPTDSTTERTHYCYTSIMEPTGQIYTDQTGRFITPSSNGNNYLLILYDYDSNAILAEPLPSRTGPAILKGYKTIHELLCRSGIRPKLQRLDNECSDALKQYMTDANIDFQLVPPGVHRRNAAERAIRTFKNHFIAGLCSVDKDFPLHLWDRLVPQALVTLNMLRGSRLNPKLSAWTQIHGTFDYNRTPIAPPGIRVLVHEKPEKRTTWSPHALDGWYTGPALNSYRCYRIWIWETRAERICDTISWFPTKVTMPLASSNDLILAGLHDIMHAIQHPSPGSPLAPVTDSHVAALKQLSTLLTGLTAPTTTTPLMLPSAPPLRVDTTPIRPAQPDEGAAPLRVVELITPVPAMIMPTQPSKVDIIAPTHKQVTFAVPTSTPPPMLPSPTFDNSTGPAGRRRRRQKAHNKKSPTKPPPITKRIVAPHPHETRSKTRPPAQHAAASATTPAPVSDEPPFDQHFALHGNAFNPDTGQIADYLELSRCSEGPLWIESCADEIGRLCHGHGTEMKSGTETMFFIRPDQIPQGRKATYLRIVAAFRPEKTNPRRVRFTCGGDRVEYPGNVSTKTADLITVKIMLNSVLSTPNARFMTADLKDFYLNTPMERYEYMRIPVAVIPESIMIEYNLRPLIKNGYAYVEIRKGMYGLPQAGRIANDRLVKFLEPHGYVPTRLTHGLWKHKTRDLRFTLVVDDFGVKYTNKIDAEHLVKTLRQLYGVSVDWDGTRYCGIHINWNYAQHWCDIGIPGYVQRALKRFQHPQPTIPQHSPHAWQKPIYGAKTQYAPAPDLSPALDPTDIKFIQQVLGTFLFYGRAIDSTMLATIGDIATEQTHGTAATMQAVTHFLNYCATHPDATVRFIASDMILWTESDASYLSVTKARSRAAGYHYLSSLPKDPTKPPQPTDPPPPSNGAINVVCQIMREVVSSAAEAELGACFHNGKEICPIRITLEELGHPQPPTPMQTDNSTATGIANDTVKQKRSKAIDMRYYWVRDRVRQGHFHIYWKKGILNKADYFTKHHPTSHHQQIRSSYLHMPTKNRSQNYFECLQEDEENEPTTKSSNPQDPDSTDSGEGV